MQLLTSRQDLRGQQSTKLKTGTGDNERSDWFSVENIGILQRVFS